MWSLQFTREDETYSWFEVRLNLKIFWYVQELFVRPIIEVKNIGVLLLLDNERITANNPEMISSVDMFKLNADVANTVGYA